MLACRSSGCSLNLARPPQPCSNLGNICDITGACLRLARLVYMQCACTFIISIHFPECHSP